MNLLLLRGGYPPIAGRPEERKTYLDTLEYASLRDDLRPFETFIYERLKVTLSEYVGVLREAPLRNTVKSYSFIDRSLGVEPLRSRPIDAGLRVEIHDYHFERDEEDQVWLFFFVRWSGLDK